MTGGLVWVVVGLGLGVVVVRRRAAALALVTAQSVLIAIGAFALTPHRSKEFLVASGALLLKAAVLALLLAWTLRRTIEQRPVDERLAPLARFAATIALALGVTALVPTFGLESRSAEQATVALVAIGIAVVVARSATLFQALGLLIAENGLAVAATAVHGGLPLVIELGVVFDLIVIVSVATAFHERIFGELGTADTALLRGLRD